MQLPLLSLSTGIVLSFCCNCCCCCPNYYCCRCCPDATPALLLLLLLLLLPDVLPRMAVSSAATLHLHRVPTQRRCRILQLQHLALLLLPLPCYCSCCCCRPSCCCCSVAASVGGSHAELFDGANPSKKSASVDNYFLLDTRCHRIVRIYTTRCVYYTTCIVRLIRLIRLQRQEERSLNERRRSPRRQPVVKYDEPLPQSRVILFTMMSSVDTQLGPRLSR